ncbi:MAG: hypothetical protein O2851_05610, partial [Proteobacteria bacterium]|nr:hypothetical protein [Pseudomonadota bacterium]
MRIRPASVDVSGVAQRLGDTVIDLSCVRWFANAVRAAVGGVSGVQEFGAAIRASMIDVSGVQEFGAVVRAS